MFVPKLYQNFKPKQWNLLKNFIDTYSDSRGSEKFMQNTKLAVIQI